MLERHQEFLRRLFLRNRAPHRLRAHRRDGQALRPGLARRARPSGRARRHHPEQGLEAGQPGPALASRRNPDQLRIGQGYVSATPLQLAVMAARVANGGYAVPPHLARDRWTATRLMRAQGHRLARLGVSRPVIVGGAPRHVHGGQRAAVAPPMARASRTRPWRWPARPARRRCGASRMRERDTGVKKNEELPWKERDHALFVAFAPVAAPRYACGVGRAWRRRLGGGGADRPRPADRGAARRRQRTCRPIRARPRRPCRRRCRCPITMTATIDDHDHGANPGGGA